LKPVHIEESNVPGRLDGRVALVTGAAGGLGAAICNRLAADGATVVVSDLSSAGCREVADALAEPAWSTTLDVADESSWHSAIAATVDRFDGLHVLVNNAGIGAPTTVETETLETWERVIGVSQRGVWLGMKHAGPAIVASGGGSIVNVGSILGAVGGFGRNHSYSASKGALRAMTKNAALHWAISGVRVNAVVPGFIATEAMLAANADARDRAILERTPLGRLGEPHEVAAVVAFAASSDASFMTGTELYVDGGWTAR
jgi:NAD(P)-dependent dehydrogenase (short-subunit alcohol dehydrogenase family)